MLAASVFYKHFENPIERTAEPAGDGTNLNFRNADHGQEYGLELEARLNGGRFSPRLEVLNLEANFSYIHSAVEETFPTADGTSTVRTSRPLQGQSPYVVNVALGYRRGGTQLALLYNVFGKRLIEVGTAGAGDVYEQPFHRLDVTFNQKLPQASR